ncbi:hypothetical protein MNV49_007489 [Pseudohyphozyma bogoriensis]|nr:hypothetical protein MNV49_007489 [Pseudohyphozyma bogoriensis]
MQEGPIVRVSPLVGPALEISHPNHLANVPKGTCKDFYHTGRCRFSVDCRYNHDRTLSSQQPSTSKAATPTFEDLDGIASHTNSDALQGDVDPNWKEGAFRSLWQKLESAGEGFGRNDEVYLWVRGLLSTTKETATWDFQDTQTYLAKLANPSGNLLSRLRDILTTPAHTNSLYLTFHANADFWVPATQTCIEALVKAKDPRPSYLSTFEKALVEHPSLVPFIESLNNLFELWALDVISPTPTFHDWIVTTHELPSRKFLVGAARDVLKRLEVVIERSQRAPITVQHRPAAGLLEAALSKTSVIAGLNLSYDPPGALREQGPRHDNDFASIRDIKVLPTHQELTCSTPSFLPANIPSSPHHLPPGSMERHVDILFRLFREDSVRPIRTAVQSLIMDREEGRGGRKRELMRFLSKGGGKWKSRESGAATVNLNLYADVGIYEIEVQPRKEIAVILRFKSAPGFLRESLTASSKKLAKGNLVGLLLEHHDEQKIFLGTVADEQPKKESAGSAFFHVKVVFYDDEVYHAAVVHLHARNRTDNDDDDQILFFEVPGFLLATVLPFLSSLQNVDTSGIPFQPFIAGTTVKDAEVEGLQPPSFASNPRFRVGVKLVQTLLANKIGPILIICYTNHALDQFLEHLYDAGVQQIVRCGSRSKSEKLQALTLYELGQLPDNAIRPTTKRELAAEHGIREEIERELQTICSVASSYSRSYLKWDAASEFLKREYPEQFEALLDVPEVLVKTYDEFKDGEWEMRGLKLPRFKPKEEAFNWWQQGADISFLNSVAPPPPSALSPTSSAPRTTNAFGVLPNEDYEKYQDSDDEWVREALDDSSIYSSEEEQFLSAADSEEVAAPPAPSWTEPTTDRTLYVLLEEWDVWRMSKVERQRLVQYWSDGILEQELSKLARLRKRHAEIVKRIEALRNGSKLAILQKAKIIGCTTNGAANLLSVLSGATPKVVMVEEAGECLESHVLVNLVPSTKHLILIGDHLQLRPQVSCYELSIDSKTGKTFRLDESLFEPLFNAGVPFSMLQTQRRMRPEIANLVRNTLYPKLLDHDTVTSFPDVRGISKNVLFFNHQQEEDRQAGDSTSRTNTYEAKMIVDLVVHFLNQGYQPGDIAVLTAYLGQLKLIRNLLAKVNVVVEIHERDAQRLETMGLSDDLDDADPGKMETCSAGELITLRTVDNFQGEEAKIVLLSLVRNVKSSTDEQGGTVFDSMAQATIGFLKSPNRANVALSRAQHGMFIFGSAALLTAKSPMWAKVIQNLEEQDSVLGHLPIRCNLHPDTGHHVAEPGTIARIAPEGGCLATCSFPLSCGHECRRVCHPNDRAHRIKKCAEDCAFILPCSHPCQNRCSDPHGPCRVPIPVVALPCGHTVFEVACTDAQHPELLECKARICFTPPCGHPPVVVACGFDATTFKCQHACGGTLDCRHGACKALCYICTTLTTSKKSAVKLHVDHLCERERPQHQVCPACATSEQKASIADLIMQETLEEAAKGGATLLTLGCGHVFTVETLDGHLGLGDYYDASPTGE